MSFLKTKTALMAAALSFIVPSPAAAQSSDVQCLMQVMNHEAGNQGRIGQTAVAYVVMNRIRSGRFASTPCAVIRQRGQFPGVYGTSIPKSRVSQLRDVATTVLSSYSRANDPTRGAVSFHNHSVRPNWRNLVRTVTIGGHIFYKFR